MSIFSQSAKHYSPRPTNLEYVTGYFYRYFCQLANQRNGEITEISITTYQHLKVSPMYRTTIVRWSLLQNAVTDATTGFSISKKAEEANATSIKLAEIDLPGISQVLINPSQFVRD